MQENFVKTELQFMELINQSDDGVVEVKAKHKDSERYFKVKTLPVYEGLEEI